MDDGFKTLRGFVSGKEPGEEIYFAYSATFRIFGEIPNFEEISSHLSLQPTKVHLKATIQAPEVRGFGMICAGFFSARKSSSIRDIDAL